VARRLAARNPEVELLVVHRETQERFALYLSACDALVFTSFQEGSPNVVKQAMACNLPIVATDVGDVRKVIGNTDGCATCAPSVGDFADAVDAILSRGSRTNGREHVRHLDSPNVARQVMQVYEELVNR
jgi:glycosyltransferase involved in cell wall biosynthesis